MSKKLRVKLLPDWRPYDNPDGPSSFVRGDGEGVLQVSVLAYYKSGKAPRPTKKQLVDFAIAHGERNQAGELARTSSGSCTMGKFGSAVFSDTEHAHIQLWYLSNGYDFVLATFICATTPDEEELDEAEQIVRTLDLPKPEK